MNDDEFSDLLNNGVPNNHNIFKYLNAFKKINAFKKTGGKT